MKRIVLFLATNLAIMLVLSVSLRVLGVEPYLNEQGINLSALLVFAAVMGFGTMISPGGGWGIIAGAAVMGAAVPVFFTAVGMDIAAGRWAETQWIITPTDDGAYASVTQRF